MRKLNNYEAVKINSKEEATEFLKYLADNTDLRWRNGEKPTEVNKELLSDYGFPVLFEAHFDQIWLVKPEGQLEAKTKIIPLSEFIKPKVTYTREQAEKVFADYNLFLNIDESLDQTDIEFLDHKFPKSTLEQVTEAVKDLGNFKIEQTISGTIMISPINK